MGNIINKDKEGLNTNHKHSMNQTPSGENNNSMKHSINIYASQINSPIPRNKGNEKPNKDIEIISKYFEKCNQYYQEAHQYIKDMSYQEGLELLVKIEIAFGKLSEIIENKNEEYVQVVREKIKFYLKKIENTKEFCQKQLSSKYEIKHNSNSLIENGNKKVDYLRCLRSVSIDETKNKNYVIKEIKKESIKHEEKKNNNSRNDRIVINSNTNTNINTNTKSSINTNTIAPKTNNGMGKSVMPNDINDKISSEIMIKSPGVKFSDVIGLEDVKQILKEIIIIPNLRPDLFTGLRSPPRGLLLFGPPGTGKTLIAKAVATECKSTFFNISAASLTSKYVGEGEKLVRSLFEQAFSSQPSIIFIDEIESILSKRNENENEASKRLKTEFLIQFDGVNTNLNDKVLIIGATNRPQDLDSAVIRRLPKRVYIGPLNEDGRVYYIKNVMSKIDHYLSNSEFNKIGKLTNFYSNSDLKELCREAAYEPIRELGEAELKSIQKIRPINFKDMVKATKKVRGTLTEGTLKELEEWNNDYGAIN